MGKIIKIVIMCITLLAAGVAAILSIYMPATVVINPERTITSIDIILLVFSYVIVMMHCLATRYYDFFDLEYGLNENYKIVVTIITVLFIISLLITTIHL